MNRNLVLAAAIALAWAAPGEARVTKIVVDQKVSPAFCTGTPPVCPSFGDAGQYETLTGRAFGELSVEYQEAVVGRRRADGAPLSGGDQRDEVSLTSKTADGRYVTPVGSHARAAHPGPTGSALMLRRGYSYADGADVGLVFTCFQRDLRTFVATQQRIDEQDEMMRYVTTTASASFLVLPGFDHDRPLGSSLLAG
jgi:deferrochelatase/peroxidase EfeB